MFLIGTQNFLVRLALLIVFGVIVQPLLSIKTDRKLESERKSILILIGALGVVALLIAILKRFIK